MTRLLVALLAIGLLLGASGCAASGTPASAADVAQC